MSWLKNAAGSIIGAAADLFGGMSTNSANAAEAKKQREWQERMSNTEMTRRVADLKNAGLNPMLAYTQGGASTPSGAKAEMQNPGARMSQHVSNAMSANLIKSQIEKTNADTATAEATARNIDLDSMYKEMSMPFEGYGKEKSVAEVRNLNIQTDTLLNQAYQGKINNQFLERLNQLEVQLREQQVLATARPKTLVESASALGQVLAAAAPEIKKQVQETKQNLESAYDQVIKWLDKQPKSVQDKYRPEVEKHKQSLQNPNYRPGDLTRNHKQ